MPAAVPDWFLPDDFVMADGRSTQIPAVGLAFG